MARITFPLILAGVLAVLAPDSAAAKCRIDKPDILGRIVRPAALAAMGDGLVRWDVDGAYITERDGTLKALVGLRDAANWLDPPYFVVRAADCGRGAVVAGYQAWDVALGLRASAPEERARPGWLP